ncbi:MAG: DAK2 domain-containing protein [Oscillospiraceae bacterium]|nr:DAK2 domain-containing protein [Oscillospiraceae bacterium]
MAITKIDGELYRRMLVGAAAALRSRKQEIDDLNVFPVPDGDTGTNMCMTLDAVSTQTEEAEHNLSDYAEKTARDIMRSARGNSGVILSLFFRGMARTFKGHEEADAELLTEAFEAGAEDARKAVMKPVEGTILTVMRECCKIPQELRTSDIGQLIERFSQSAQETLKKTPDMLPALKKAKVVDSGGSGFTAVLEGMKRVLNGESFTDYSFAGAPGEGIAADFDAFEDEEITFGFCTECLINKKPELPEQSVQELRSYLMGMGDSVVMTDDDEIIKVHIHTNEPFTVLQRIMALGELQITKVENMRLQQARKAAANRVKKGEKEAKKPWAVVAVANGDGLADTFTQLGVDQVVKGGQSMNPSAGDFLKALKTLNCEQAIFLPNNPNIVLTARQAADMARIPVLVIPTITIPQGVAAMVAFDPEADRESNEAAMEEARSAVVTLSITEAVRDAEAEGLQVQKGQFIGLVNNKLRYADDSLDGCLRFLAGEIEGRELITVYCGEGATEEETEALVNMLQEMLGEDAEILATPGSQPIYRYIISAE